MLGNVLINIAGALLLAAITALWPADLSPLTPSPVTVADKEIHTP